MVSFFDVTNRLYHQRHLFICCFSSSPVGTRNIADEIGIVTEFFCFSVALVQIRTFNFSNEVSTTVSFISEIDAPPSRFSSLSSSLDIPSENEIGLRENQENNSVIPAMLDTKECQDLDIFVPEKQRITFLKLPDYTDVKELETDLESKNDCNSMENENLNPNELEDYYDSKIGVLQHGRYNHIS